MSPRIPTDLRNILATLYPDERSIRRVVDDAGVDSSKMVIDTHALNSWHSVLSEAEKNHQVEALLKAVEAEYGNNQAFRSAYHTYRQATSGSIGIDSASKTRVNHQKTQRDPQRQWLPAAIIGLLLIAIISAGWYWGIPGLRNTGIAISRAGTTIVPDTDRTEVPQADAPSTALAAASPSNNTATLTRTQVSAMSFTSTPEPPTSTPTATFTVTPALTETPTPEPTGAATLIPTPTYPCEATVFSASGGDIINRIRAIPSSSGGLKKGIQKGTEVEVREKRSVDSEVWYHIFDQESRELGWILSTDLRLSSSCPV